MPTLTTRPPGAALVGLILNISKVADCSFYEAGTSRLLVNMERLYRERADEFLEKISASIAFMAARHIGWLTTQGAT